LLGLNGNVVIAHGSSRERAIMNAIGQAVKAVQHHVNQVITRELSAASHLFRGHGRPAHV
jgi:fatty acid/phospholipid biosynthesis enzyme